MAAQSDYQVSSSVSSSLAIIHSFHRKNCVHNYRKYGNLNQEVGLQTVMDLYTCDLGNTFFLIIQHCAPFYFKVSKPMWASDRQSNFFSAIPNNSANNLVSTVSWPTAIITKTRKISFHKPDNILESLSLSPCHCVKQLFPGETDRKKEKEEVIDRERNLTSLVLRSYITSCSN